MEYIILFKKLISHLSEKEEAIFDAWYAESPVHREYFDGLKHREPNRFPDMEAAWKKIVSGRKTD
ncbi:hypothetical protein [Sinomicrobium sp. M5D2P17]